MDERGLETVLDLDYFPAMIVGEERRPQQWSNSWSFVAGKVRDQKDEESEE